MSIYHCYMVFNPLFNQGSKFKTQAHEFHDVFKEKIEAGSASEFYWGKIKKSKNHPRPDVKKLNEIIKENSDAGLDTYLFLSDFANFWVAKITGALEGTEEVKHELISKKLALDYYDNEDVEVWFRITDFDLLCTGRETFERIAALKVDHPFYTEKYDSLNPYIGGLKYPMIVEDTKGDDYFQTLNAQSSVLRIVEHNPLLENNGLEEVDHLISTVSSYSIPGENFSKLPEMIKKQILWSEHLFSGVRLEGYQETEIQRKSMQEVAFSYLRILEGLLNATLMKSFKTKAEDDIVQKIKKDSFSRQPDEKNRKLDDIRKKLRTSQSIQDIQNILFKDWWEGVRLSVYFERTEYQTFWKVCNELIGPDLQVLISKYQVVNFRNGIAHLSSDSPIVLSVSDALNIRNKMLGVGCKGFINEIIEYYPDPGITNHNNNNTKKAA